MNENKHTMLLLIVVAREMFRAAFFLREFTVNLNQFQNGNFGTDLVWSMARKHIDLNDMETLYVKTIATNAEWNIRVHKSHIYNASIHNRVSAHADGMMMMVTLKICMKFWPNHHHMDKNSNNTQLIYCWKLIKTFGVVVRHFFCFVFCLLFCVFDDFWT